MNSIVTVSWAVMAHPQREAFIPELLGWLGEPDMPVVWDERNSRWDTGRRSMLAYDPGCTHHAVIQDDVLPCRDLVTALPQILERVDEGCPLCGYVGAVRPALDAVNAVCAEADRRGASFLRMRTLNWGPLIVVPTEVISEMIAFCDPLRDISNYDRRLSRYWELARKLPIWYTWPAVVDHRDGPSMVPGRMGTHHRPGINGKPGSRVARRFLGMDGSALEHDWSGPVVDEGAAPGPLVRFRNRNTGQVMELRPTSPRIRRMNGITAWERLPEEATA